MPFMSIHLAVHNGVRIMLAKSASSRIKSDRLKKSIFFWQYPDAHLKFTDNESCPSYIIELRFHRIYTIDLQNRETTLKIMYISIISNCRIIRGLQHKWHCLFLRSKRRIKCDAFSTL